MAQSREGSAYLGDTGKASQRKQLELSLEIWVPSARLVGVEGGLGRGQAFWANRWQEFQGTGDISGKFMRLRPRRDKRCGCKETGEP